VASVCLVANSEKKKWTSRIWIDRKSPLKTGKSRTAFHARSGLPATEAPNRNHYWCETVLSGTWRLTNNRRFTFSASVPSRIRMRATRPSALAPVSTVRWHRLTIQSTVEQRFPTSVRTIGRRRMHYSRILNARELY